MKHIICLVGKTCSGKDTVASYIKLKWGIDQVCSYTTRPKRSYETNGKEHRFVSKDFMSSLKRNERLLAYYRNPETHYEYCATMGCLTEDTMIYIINPDGVVYLKKRFPDIKVTSIYLNAPTDLLIERGIQRGDSTGVLTERLTGENKEFNEFYLMGRADYVVNADSLPEGVSEQISKIMEKIYECKSE